MPCAAPVTMTTVPSSSPIAVPPGLAGPMPTTSVTRMTAPAGSFAGKVAIVTGAAGGIGRASALAFAAKGAHVLVADINDDHGHETVSLITSAGGSAQLVRTDVSQSTDVAAMV